MEDELEREARRFVNEQRNLRIDDEARIIHLSSIFDWYRDDFLSHMVQANPQIADADLLDYARLYLRPETMDAVDRARAAGYGIQIIAYDWRLNDQRQH